MVPTPEGAAWLYIALVGGTPQQRDVARATYLNRADVQALAIGEAIYNFFVASEEREADLVQPHEWHDTLRVSDRVLPGKAALLAPELARAWGVQLTSSSVHANNERQVYRGPRDVRSAGRWNFLLVNVFRHALSLQRGFRYLIKPELDGITCVDGLVATLKLTAAWPVPWYGCFLRGCHADESLGLYSRAILEAIDRHWEASIVPTLRSPAELMSFWSQHGRRYGMRNLPSFHGRYMPAILRWLVQSGPFRAPERAVEPSRNAGQGAAASAALPRIWMFSSARSYFNHTIPGKAERALRSERAWYGDWPRRQHGFVYLHSGLDKSIELQWRWLRREALAAGRPRRPLAASQLHSATLPTRSCNGERSICALQKLSCKFAVFIHKIKNLTTVRELWAAQLAERYDYRASAFARLRDLAEANVTARVLYPNHSAAGRACQFKFPSQRKRGAEMEGGHASCACEHAEVVLSH